MTSANFRHSSPSTVTSSSASRVQSGSESVTRDIEFFSHNNHLVSLPKTRPSSSKTLQQPPHRSVTFDAALASDVTFAQYSYRGSIAENLPPGVVVTSLSDLTVVPTSSSIPHRVVYKLDSSLNFRLRHDGKYVTSPLLLSNRTFDREQQGSYSLVVSACADVMCDDNIWIHAKVDVVIDDVNDNVPQFDSSHYDVAIDSDLSLDSDVITLLAHDPDQGQVRYEFVGSVGDKNMFNLEPRSGRVTLAAAQTLTTSIYELRVRAVDDGGLTSDVTSVFVRVTCVLPLYAPAPSGSRLKRSSDPDVKVVQISEDVSGNLLEFNRGDRRHYFLEKKPFPRKLELLGDAGVLRLRDGFELDHETQASIEFTVIVVERENPDCKFHPPSHSNFFFLPLYRWPAHL